jgi:hypothetical protein
MRTLQIIGSWLIICLLYWAIFALVVVAVLLANHLMGRQIVLLYRTWVLLIFVTGIIASLPSLVSIIKKSRR